MFICNLVQCRFDSDLAAVKTLLVAQKEEAPVPTIGDTMFSTMEGKRLVSSPVGSGVRGNTQQGSIPWLSAERLRMRNAVAYSWHVCANVRKPSSRLIGRAVSAELTDVGSSPTCLKGLHMLAANTLAVPRSLPL